MGQYNSEFAPPPRRAIKFQVLIDFIVEWMDSGL
jgi:hypothetical protein